MISLDWKERLIKDTYDFCKNKLSTKDYRFDVIYNAYPAREGHNIPNEVLTLVAKEMAKFMDKNLEPDTEFLDYLWYQGQANGKFILANILNKIYNKDIKKYYAKMLEYLDDAQDSFEKGLIIDKVFYPLLKKQPEKYITIAYNWASSGDLELEVLVLKAFTKLCKSKPEYTKQILRHLENNWSYAPQEMIKALSQFFKDVGKIDRELYLDTFDFYDNSRDPNVVEILTASINFYHEDLERIVEEWTKSGNARLKKCALSGYKHLLKLKNRG